MSTPVVAQRWRERRDTYRPAGEVIDPRAYDVAPLDEGDAKAFVLANHYSRTYPAARFRFGLYQRGTLAGVAVFSHPVQDKVLTKVFPAHPAAAAVELGRFVLLDEVPANGETFFLARCFDALREHVVGVVSFSDPIPRTDVHGRVLFPGHIGGIYQAASARFIGRGERRLLRLLPDARVFSTRAASKIRKLERGWRYCVEQLEAAGARPYQGGADAGAARAWLAVELQRVTRPLSHPGNFKYCWAFERRDRRALPAALPYPKRLPAPPMGTAVAERRAA